MATTVAKKDTLGNKLARAKNTMQEKIRSAKAEYKEKKEKLKKAHKIGYDSGAKDYEKIPKGKGMINKAGKGYSKALKDSSKHEQLSKKLNK